jgi:hypothetical protein
VVASVAAELLAPEVAGAGAGYENVDVAPPVTGPIDAAGAAL